MTIIWPMPPLAEITPERLKEMATDVYDSAVKGSNKPNYNWLLELATGYNLGKERTDRALEGKYAEELYNSSLGGRKLSDTAKQLPKEKAEEIERNALLDLLRRGGDEGAVRLIRKIAGDYSC